MSLRPIGDVVRAKPRGLWVLPPEMRPTRTASPLWRKRPGKGQSNSGAGISSLSGLGPTSPHHPVLRALSTPMENSRQRHDTACQRKSMRGSSGSAQHGKCRAGERPASRRPIGDRAMLMDRALIPLFPWDFVSSCGHRSGGRQPRQGMFMGVSREHRLEVFPPFAWRGFGPASFPSTPDGRRGQVRGRLSGLGDVPVSWARTSHATAPVIPAGAGFSRRVACWR